MKCSIIGPLHRPGPCDREAVTVNVIGHAVCAQCKEDSDYLAALINKLSELHDLPLPYPTINWRQKLAEQN